MKNIKNNCLKYSLLITIVVFANVSCERELSEDAILSTYPKTAEVYIDGFSAGLSYGAFAGSKYTAFNIDTNEKYAGSSSMRIDVPSENDPEGNFAGGVYIDDIGRNLTDYDALTFWVKGSQAATINEVGFGNDFNENKYNVSLKNVSIDTNWKKVIIPIPNASKLIQEKGMFWYAEGPENGLGYTFWMDNVQYEKLGTITDGQASILNGNDKVETSFIGVSSTIDGVVASFNLANGISKTVTISPAYLEFSSSNTAVASVTNTGVVTTVGTGTATITATFEGQTVDGSLTINSLGTFLSAPTPTHNPANVISIFSDAYANVPVNYYNGYWAPWQTSLSDDFSVNGDHILQYTIFNFAGIEFSTPTVNASAMTHFHLDAFIPGPIASGRLLRLVVVDFGPDGTFNGGDDTRHSTTFIAPFLVSQNWISIDIPFLAMPNLLSRSHVAQIILEGGDGSNIYIDNIYFHN